jgi:two-component system probable response regulator PhcQ
MRRDKVLLVDDEPGSLLILRKALRNEPYEVLTAASGEAAMATIQQQPIDAVVTDQEMPGMSGTDLMALLRRDYPTTARFILTGRATLEVALDAINMGAIHRFFVKPCNVRELAVSLRQALRQKRLLEESRKLLAALRRQSATLENLEAQYPGISDQNRDNQGAFVIEDLIEDFDDLLKQIDESVGVA